MGKERIGLNDTQMDVFVKMAGGNPGALTVLMTIMKESSVIDPQNLMGGLGQILSLDANGIYEHRIWMLYKDVCGEDIEKMLACLRAIQLGQLSLSELNAAIDGGENEVDVTSVLSGVKERLGQFGREV